METIRFIDDKGTFSIENPENYSYLYFPIANERGIKSALTPNLGGDSKLNQNAFLLEPVSSENLHNNRSTRNFWCKIKGKSAWSVTGASAESESCRFTDKQEQSVLTAGLMWHTLERETKEYGLCAEITSFVPLGHNVEVMQVTITNTGEQAIEFTPVAAVPIYGRSADNIRDHRHVTSLLHRITTMENGVWVKPTLSFDERGHKVNDITYFVCGVTGNGENPVSFYPMVEDYLGEGGTYTQPRAVIEDKNGVPAGIQTEGGEAFGGLHFADVCLAAGEYVKYTVLLGATADTKEIGAAIDALRTAEKVEAELEAVKEYWQKEVNIWYRTGNKEFDNYMRWVSFQPFLRRIYGCSFLPHHDYGKGGRGWRDLWQDCLALLMMNPDGVRQMLLDNYGGVRIDGTNATIIGEKQGEFIADRNNITRVWMDHGVWPFMTTKLYMDQTGDIDILNQPVTYFKDRQIERGTGVDEAWEPEQGNKQLDVRNNCYEGTVLEHILLQHLCAFYEVGDHNYLRLRGADWNDALDMAEEKGESVAFTCAYAGNLKQLARYVRLMGRKHGRQQIELLSEVVDLLGGDSYTYDDLTKKRAILTKYVKQCRHRVSGTKVLLNAEVLAKNLEAKADWMIKRIQTNEWISEDEANGWFNSYYDNHGNAVEGPHELGVRMMLTGQVFAIMNKIADKKQIASICNSADRYLYDEKAGGYRINTNFQEEKYDMGRMFGFAYGEKENGAVFSHMTVMFANALYKSGFAKEGYKALQTLADTALHFETSRIYPGIPEYFNAKGRGMYHYLTGAASWYMMTMVTEVFGVRGENGDLLIEPKLLAEQFDESGCAQITLPFAGKTIEVIYRNTAKKTYGEYKIARIVMNGEELAVEGDRGIIAREIIEAYSGDCHKIEVELL